MPHILESVTSKEEIVFQTFLTTAHDMLSKIRFTSHTRMRTHTHTSVPAVESRTSRPWMGSVPRGHGCMGRGNRPLSRMTPGDLSHGLQMPDVGICKTACGVALEDGVPGGSHQGPPRCWPRLWGPLSSSPRSPAGCHLSGGGRTLTASWRCSVPSTGKAHTHWLLTVALRGENSEYPI